MEEQSFTPRPTIHLERTDQVRSGAHRGPGQEREWQQFYYHVLNGNPAERLQLSAQGCEAQSLPLEGLFRIPAGLPFRLELVDAQGHSRCHREVLFPAFKHGGRDVRETQADLVVRALPNFLYPDEIGELYLATRQHRVPIILPKERVLNGPKAPDARPEGEYALQIFAPELHLNTTLSATPFGILEADPTIPRTAESLSDREIRIPFPVARWAKRIPERGWKLELRLTCGDTPIDSIALRIMDARHPLPKTLFLAEGSFWLPASASPAPLDQIAPNRERLLFVVPRENEAEYRRFALLNNIGTTSSAPPVYLGDPLAPPGNSTSGLPKLLDSQITLEPSLLTPTSDRSSTVFRILQNLTGSEKLPLGVSSALVFLGSADVEMQTPLHDFERSLDLLIDQLRLRGVHEITLIGPLPKPQQRESAKRYQEVVVRVAKQHRLGQLDLVSAWSAAACERYYAVKPDTRIFCTHPNHQGLQALAKLIKATLH